MHKLEDAYITAGQPINQPKSIMHKLEGASSNLCMIDLVGGGGIGVGGGGWDGVGGWGGDRGWGPVRGWCGR
jgi:hypothetical protein